MAAPLPPTPDGQPASASADQDPIAKFADPQLLFVTSETPSAAGRDINSPSAAAAYGLRDAYHTTKHGRARFRRHLLFRLVILAIIVGAVLAVIYVY